MPRVQRNWRRSYHLRMQDHFDELLEEYCRGSWRPQRQYDAHDTILPVCEMDHEDRVRVAWREAEKDIHRAMIDASDHEWEEALRS